LKESDDAELAGLAAKIDREEIYHRMHAEMWADRLHDEPRFTAAVDSLWPSACTLLPESLRPQLAERLGRPLVEGPEGGEHVDGFDALWEEMTEVRRSVPGATW